MNKIQKFANEMHKQFMKVRKVFRKSMGTKTIKIDGLQHFKLTLVKMELSKRYGKTLKYGDVIEYLCEEFTRELKNEQKKYTIEDYREMMKTGKIPDEK